MGQTAVRENVVTLETRLSRGAAILFDMEQRGDTGAEYERWLDRWTELLSVYEESQAA
jgi:hypothetical protein